jgi:hypothetical protein
VSNIAQNQSRVVESFQEFQSRTTDVFLVVNIEQIEPLCAGYYPDYMAIRDLSQTVHGETRRSWQEIAQEVTQEQDPTKVRELSVELNQAMLDEERRKVRLRLQCSDKH